MNRLLIVVDYQNDFVSGSLGFEGADKIEDRILELIKEFKENRDFICFTKDTHENDYMSTVEGSNLPISHCVKGTKGHDLTPRVEFEVGFNPVFEKNTFPSLELGNFIHGLSPMINEIYLCGLVSDICVFSNAIIAKAAANKNCKIKVVKDATSSNNLEAQDKAFEMLEHLHIEII
jgi:nicotinamidase-related amidase